MVPTRNYIFFNEAAATGTSTPAPMPYSGEATIAVSGTFVGTITVEGEKDGAWHTMTVLDTANMVFDDAITAAGIYGVICAEGVDNLRAKITSFTSGKITVSAKLTFIG